MPVVKELRALFEKKRCFIDSLAASFKCKEKCIDNLVTPKKLRLPTSYSGLFKASYDATDRLLRAIRGRFFTKLDLSALIEHQVQQRTEELYRKANYDALTHLPNRRYFHEMLDELVNRHAEHQKPFTLLFLDLDHFKQVNDTLGHQIGDELLRHVSARLISSVREVDTVSRLGGDEFVVLLRDTADTEVIEAICKRTISETSRPYCLGNKEVRTSTSIGIASFPQDAKTTTDLVAKADEALYKSKTAGKKTYRFYKDMAGDSLIRHSDTQNQFEFALRSGLLTPYVEPQYGLIDDALAGLSITLHWKNDNIVNPFMSGWLPELKKSGWEHSVGMWLLDSGFYYAQQWQKKSPELVVSIPMLEAVWRSEDCLKLLLSRVKKFNLSVSQIQLEFSLKELAQYDLFFQKRLQALSKAGFQLTLTDVGSAPFDLALLSGLSIQEFKLDATWLKTNLESDQGKKWVQAIIQMATSLDACVIATGVNNRTSVDTLKKMGCRMAQGRYWSAPFLAESFQK